MLAVMINILKKIKYKYINIKYWTLSFSKIKFYDSIFSGRVVSREGHDIQSKKKYEDIYNNRKFSLSAVYRVNNGEKYLELSVLSVAPLCDQIIIVDNNSTDKTLEIAYRLREELKGICDVVISQYNEKLSLAGKGYIDNVIKNPNSSLSKFYTYCFGLATSEYLMKCDAHYIFSPRGLSLIQKKLNKRPNIVRYRGQEITGGYITHETFIFKNDGWYFKDLDMWEFLILPDSYNKNLVMNTIFEPCFLHVKRISYSKFLLNDSENVVSDIYSSKDNC